MIAPEKIAALGTTVLRAIAAAEAVGWELDPVVGRAMALVEGLGRGEKATKAQLRAIRAEVDAVETKHGKWTDARGKGLFWIASQANNTLFVAVSGEDHGADVLRQLAYGLPGEDGEAREQQVLAWYADALAATKRLARPAKKTAKPSPVAAEKLAACARVLGKDGALLRRRHARFDPKGTASRAKVAERLARAKYPAHESVLDFEERFGGLLIPEDERDHEEGRTLVGAYACLRSKAHVHPGGGGAELVPVAYTPSDGIVFLDAAGQAWFEDAIEDRAAKRFAPSGAAAVAKLLRAG